MIGKNKKETKKSGGVYRQIRCANLFEGLTNLQTRPPPPTGRIIIRSQSQQQPCCGPAEVADVVVGVNSDDDITDYEVVAHCSSAGVGVVAKRRQPMKMLQSLNTLASKISPGSPTDGNANKVHMHNNNNNNNNNESGKSIHPHPYSKKPIMQQVTTIATPSSNGDQKENT